MAGASNYVTVSRRPPDIEDYIDMMRRYRSWIIGPMFAGLVISVVVAFMWEDTFVSTAMMQITPQQISPRLVAADYSNQMQDRLNQMQQDILSRTSLGDMITRLNLYPKEQKRKPLDDIIQDMKNNAIRIQMVEMPVTTRTGGDGGKMISSAFAISFKYNDRYKAQQVVRELVSKFTEQNIKYESDQAKITTQFIDDELKNAKRNLDDMQTRLTDWKLKNQGRLPEQFQANVSALQSAQMEAQRVQDAIGHAQSQKLMLDQSLQNAVAEQQYYQSHVEETLMGPGQMSVKNQQLINTTNELMKFKAALASMKKQYGENYPEMNAVKAQIETLEQQKAELEKEQADSDAQAATTPAKTTKVTNPQVAQRLVEIKNQINTIRTQIAATQQDIESLTRAQAEVNKRIAGLQGRIEESPIGASQYEALLRDYNLAQQAYDTQVKKKEESLTQQNMEEHRAGQQLVQLDAPTLPEQPVEPKRPVWAAVGTVIGLMIGVVLAAVKEMKDSSLKNLKDVRAYTNLPVLSSIPLLENALLVRRKRRLFWLAWSATFIFGSLAMSASMYYHFFGRS